MSETEYKPENDPELIKYWATRGHKTAAFLLVIPGCAIMGFGMGHLLDNIVPYSIIGFGAGMFAWGLIVSLTK